jgi:hypothetical protein
MADQVAQSAAFNDNWKRLKAAPLARSERKMKAFLREITAVKIAAAIAINKLTDPQA